MLLDFTKQDKDQSQKLDSVNKVVSFINILITVILTQVTKPNHPGIQAPQSSVSHTDTHI